MDKGRIAVLTLVVAAVVTIAGCASPFQRSGPEIGATYGVGIVVEHDSPNQPVISIHLVHPSGTRRFLGSVSSGQTQTFRMSGEVSPGQYGLIAEGPNGTLRSRPFFLTDAGVRWNVSANVVAPLLSD